jgi:hypothetical protein
MLNSRAIYRLLIDDEQPAAPAGPDADFDPNEEILRYAAKPFRVDGNGPTTLYADFTHTLGGRTRRKIALNTYLINHGPAIAVRLHQTDVVTAWPDGKIMVDSGGWNPQGHQSNPWNNRQASGVTTKDRINANLDSGWQLYQQQGRWYWYNCATDTGSCYDPENTRYPYTDKDTIFPDGSLQMQADPEYPKRRKRRA